MSIKTTIDKGVSTIFKVLKSLIHSATYTAVSSDGFSTATTVDYDISVIIDRFSERDVKFLSFSEFIQPQDLKGLVKGTDLAISPSSKDYVTITDSSIYAGKYKVIAWDTDPATALFVMALRSI
jgi:hypothetical protein